MLINQHYNDLLSMKLTTKYVIFQFAILCFAYGEKEDDFALSKVVNDFSANLLSKLAEENEGDNIESCIKNH